MKELNSNLLILGAGQYGQVVKEVAESMGCFKKIDFLDDNSELAVGKFSDYIKFAKDYKYAFVAIGNADSRLDLIQRLDDAGFGIPVLVSSKAFVSPSAQLMKGTIVEPMAVVNANSLVRVGVFICAGAIVNHNSVIGDGCQLDCGSVVGSNISLQAQTKLKYSEVFDKECVAVGNRAYVQRQVRR